MLINENAIIYFSGTGNSLYVANKIADELNISQIMSVKELEKNEVTYEGEVLGIIFPTYYARIPLIVQETIEKLRISKRTYVFCIVTHGGGPSVVLKRLNNLLSKKGIHNKSGFLIKMPGNNIFNYGAVSDKRINNLIFKSIQKISTVAKKINLRIVIWDKSYLVIDTLIDFAFTLVTNKIVDNINRTSDDFTTNSTCIACGKCVELCPRKNIEIIGLKPRWKEKCEKCATCIQWCPRESINWKSKTHSRRRYKNPYITDKDLEGNKSDD